ncbi:hypothetical protein ECE50_018835 [Chitinophaga sp. Mgbs1]|uniref:Uncharacterized protein n=1 Tax=Chitinophaga solisilvae TaxID=1233460 RepID=A0A3S1JEH6_9BACT|nr:hypothetical protein [Chitinophaga solisilvae]
MQTHKKCCIIIAAVLSVLLHSYIARGQNITKPEGVFRQKENSRIRLILRNDYFLLLNQDGHDHIVLHNNTDTLAYGTWSWNPQQRLIALSTPVEWNNNILLTTVEEKEALSPDSLYIYITNPIDTYRIRNQERLRDLVYRLRLSSDLPAFDSLTKAESYTASPIVLHRPEGLHIKRISINITPVASIPVRHIGMDSLFSSSYKPLSTTANSFRFNFPALTYDFISYLRLNEDHIKVLSRYKLLWNGKEYIKTR